MNEQVDTEFMTQALALAKRALGQTSPNPLVGALIVQDGVVIGGGYHKKAGTPHAEPNAIMDAEGRGFSVEGATLYCTLEPCCHLNKKTPPCAQLIIEKKIARVVVGAVDPNPEVSGKGLEMLRAAGIEVTSGILERECNALNLSFNKCITTQKAYLHIKAAITLDGRIATATGDSKWISNKSSRKVVHQLRCQYDAVLIGRKTLEADSPSLTIRNGVFCHNKVPWKIIMGDMKNIDLSLPFFQKDMDKIIIAYTKNRPEQCNLKTLKFENWNQFLTLLYAEGICSVLVEGGAAVISSLLNSGEYDEISLFQAPKMIGNGSSVYHSEDCKEMANALCFNDFDFELIDGEYRCIHWHWRKS